VTRSQGSDISRFRIREARRGPLSSHRSYKGPCRCHREEGRVVEDVDRTSGAIPQGRWHTDNPWDCRKTLPEEPFNFYEGDL
jgi:hypothetical protein